MWRLMLPSAPGCLKTHKVSFLARYLLQNVDGRRGSVIVPSIQSLYLPPVPFPPTPPPAHFGVFFVLRRSDFLDFVQTSAYRRAGIFLLRDYISKFFNTYMRL